MGDSTGRVVWTGQGTVVWTEQGSMDWAGKCGLGMGVWGRWPAAGCTWLAAATVLECLASWYRGEVSFLCHWSLDSLSHALRETQVAHQSNLMLDLLPARPSFLPDCGSCTSVTRSCCTEWWDAAATAPPSTGLARRRRRLQLMKRRLGRLPRRLWLKAREV